MRRVQVGCAAAWDDTTGKGWPWVLTGGGVGGGSDDTLVKLGEGPHTTIKGRCHERHQGWPRRGGD